MAISKKEIIGFTGGIAAALLVSVQSFVPTSAYESCPPRGYESHVRTCYSTWSERHPKVKSAAVDGAIGAAAGGLIGGVSHRGVLHGALVGSAAGAGIGLVRSSQTMAYHPVAKTASEVGIGALGVYLAAAHGHEF